MATYTNIHGKPKRKAKPRQCPTCKKYYVPRRGDWARRYCYKCKISPVKKLKYQRLSSTIGQLRNKLAVKGKHPSWVHAEVRNFNRCWNRDLLELPCARCGYDKHVELCHIKSITSYLDTALLSEVNHPDNIVQLCPNCHWEFDRKFYQITKINGIVKINP